MAVTISQTSATSGDRWGVTSSYNTSWSNFVQVKNTESYTIYVTAIKIYMAVVASGSKCYLPGGSTYTGDGKPISLTFTANGKTSNAEIISNTITCKTYTKTTTLPSGEQLHQQGSTPNTITTLHTFTFSDPVPITSGSTVVFYYNATSPSGSSLSNSITGWEYSGSYALACVWNQGQYVVVFNGNGNTGGSTANQTFVVGTAQNLNANGFTKTGYSFAGWATTSTGAVVYGNQASVNNLTSAGGTFNLYAKWTANTYAITFDRQSGSGGSSSTTATYASAMPSATMPTRTGYTFGGYYTSTGGGGTKYYNADGSSAKTWDKTSATTLYAYWVPNSYTVTFNGNGGGTPSPTSKSVTYASTYGTLATCSRTGYTFAGWYTAASGGTQITSSSNVSITSAQTLYAHWNINSYTLSYDANGGSSTPSSVTKNYNTTVSLASAIARDTVTNATYTVTYNANGYGTTPSASTTYNKTYYTFSKWAAGSTSGTQYSAGASYTITSDIKMYALWSSSNSTAAITLPTISDSSNQHIFAGWYTAASGGTKVGNASASYTPSKNITLYAHWTDNNVTIQYNANGGTGSIPSDTKLYNQTTTLASSGFTKSGCKLIGWNTKADGTGTRYALGRTNYAVTANVTLYAVWYTNFSWTSNDSIYIASNQRISYATADKWNTLQNNIKKYVNSSFTVTTASAGSVIEASKIVTAANKLGVSTSGVTKDTVMYPRVFNDLRDQINAQATYLGVS